MLDVAIGHRFGAAAVDLAFAAPVPGTVALFGPSGSGKSTAVNAIAGLFAPQAGRIALGGEVLFDRTAGIFVPAERRRLGVVFQDALLFPHLSVAGNLRYGLRRAPSRGIGFDDVVALLGIGALLRRRPHTLSGGERQRVAIGRALLAQPRLLLMDEPLASLDAARRDEILPYLGRLKHALGLPIVYVTHAMAEVAALADTLVLLREGRVIACGPLSSVLSRGDLPTAERDDAAAVVAMTIAAHDPARGLTCLQQGGFRLWVPLAEGAPGTRLRARIPAREIVLAGAAPASISVHNVFAARVRAIVTDAGRRSATVEIEAAGVALLARVTADAVAMLSLGVGADVFALVKSMSIDLLQG
ncbi:MAG: molybdenum ABC transporter ATP-binding protein [Acidisphaera sp.]|nr:molybdenum ABC transporter ATP-binding protein [Acidisphaera sp.]